MGSIAYLRAVTAAAGTGLAVAIAMVSAPAPASAAAMSPPARTSTARVSTARVGTAPSARAPSALAPQAKMALARAGARRQAAGALTGTVRGLRDVPLTGACVTAVGQAGSWRASTNSSGRFSIPGLRPGLYKLEYRDCAAPGRYVPQWLGGALAAGPAVPAPSGLVRQVRISSSQVTAAPAVTLRPASPAALIGALKPAWALHSTTANAVSASARSGRISGRVTDRKGHPLKGICVYAVTSNGARAFRSHTTKTGGYLTQRLAPGKYFVAFGPGCGNNGNWLLEFYKNTTNQARAKRIRVIAGKTIGHIDGALHPGGEIKGTVTSKSGTRLNGICAIVTDKSGINELAAAATSHGSYTFTGVPPGTYGMLFMNGCGNLGNYAPQFWKDKPYASAPTPIRITYGTVASKTNAVLAPGAEISGTVTLGTATGTPLSGICVEAFGDGKASGLSEEFSTDSNGRYLIKGLASGPYELQFAPGCDNNGNYLPENYPGEVTATQGKNTTGINGVLQPGAAMTGVLTSSATGKPVGGICVTVQNVRIDDSFATDITAADGSYLADQLPTGKYTVGFSGGCGSSGSYSPQYYKDQPDQATAATVRLTQGATKSGIGGALLPGGTIAGTVTSSKGKKLSNICVTVLTAGTFSPQGPFYGFNATASSRGRYSLANLVPGEYAADFSQCSPGNLASQTFPGHPGFSARRLISVNPGQVTRGINARMQPGGVISGTLKNAAGKNLNGMCGTAVSLRDGSKFVSDDGEILGGKYTISSLPAGRYHVEFTSCDLGGGPGNYASAWYRKARTHSLASTVTVRGGHTTAGINAVMPRGGVITGHVTDGVSHGPAANICILAAGPATFSDFQFSGTNGAGNYRIQDLNTGSYYVEFEPCNSGGENLGGTVPAHLVRVRTGRTTAAVDVTLERGGSVSGTLTGGTPAQPQGDLCVFLNSVNPVLPGADVVTGAGGKFVATNLLPGKYLVYFNAPECVFGPSPLASRWYPNAPNQSAAKTVTVTAGVTTTGVSADLPSLGQITGVVTGPGHTRVSGACVTAVPRAGGPSLITAVSAGGKYSIIGLAPGRYRVEFTSGCGASGYLTQWWKNARTKAAATLISVPANAVVGGISASLRR